MRVANDIFFAVLPPGLHHSKTELSQFAKASLSRWFQYGYCAWRFTESGEPKSVLPRNIDKRWDP